MLNPVVADPDVGFQHLVHSPPTRLVSGSSGARRPSLPRRLSAERSQSITLDDPSTHLHLNLNSRPRSNSRPTMMVTPEEYEALPPSIQKKYFSSVERLRIARESASQKRKKQQPAKNQRLPPAPSMDSMRPKTAHSFKQLPLPQPRKSFSRPIRTDADVDEEQALRFLALPDKVKRLHFTPEELALLTESSERALSTPSLATDDGSPRSSALDRNGSVASSHCKSSISDGYMADLEKDWFDMDTESVDSLDYANANDVEMMKLHASRRQGSVCSSFGGLHSDPASRGLGSSPKSRQQSFSRRRAMSLAPIPLPPPTLTPAVPPLPSSNAISNFSKPIRSPSPTPTETPTVTTKYYKDSNARQKLREFLASPEKFDEAVEFGFPSERLAAERSTSLASTHAPGLVAAADSLSITDSKEDEEGLPRSPKTPSLVTDGFHSASTPHSSVDSGVSLPFTPGKANFRSLSPDIEGREMTLRMTLTRPDLRAPEQQLYSFQRKEVSGVEVADHDPLALEALSICDDHTGAHGAFAVTQTSRGGFKKVWKNLRGR